MREKERERERRISLPTRNQRRKKKAGRKWILKEREQTKWVQQIMISMRMKSLSPLSSSSLLSLSLSPHSLTHLLPFPAFFKRLPSAKERVMISKWWRNNWREHFQCSEFQETLDREKEKRIETEREREEVKEMKRKTQLERRREIFGRITLLYQTWFCTSSVLIPFHKMCVVCNHRLCSRTLLPTCKEREREGSEGNQVLSFLSVLKGVRLKWR